MDVDDLVGVAAGQVGPADASGEERVAGEDHLERREMEADGALGVTGGVDAPGPDSSASPTRRPS